MIPIRLSVRGIILVMLILSALAIMYSIRSTKEKSEYTKTTGVIEYLDKTFQNLPNRDRGKFRYLKIDSYPYVFEIYEPNHMPSEKNIDDLKIGDTIDIFYYETSNTLQESINRFTQFIDSKDQPYFIRNNFQRNLGYVLVGLCAFVSLIVIVLWRLGKLPW